MKKNRPFLILLIPLALLVAVQYFSPTPLDWSPSYAKDKKIPLGGYVLFDQIQQLFEGEEIEVVEETIYNVLQDSTLINTNYILIGNPNFSETEKTLLWDYIERGNHVFMASTFLYHSPEDEEIDDSLSMSTYFSSFEAEDSLSLHFTHPKLPDTIKNVIPRLGSGYIRQQREKWKVAGEVDGLRVFEDDKEVQASVINFSRYAHGKGSFIVSANPQMFSNYALLDEHWRDYASAALSHLPKQKILWDEYYKPGRKAVGEGESFFSVIADSPALKAALWIIGLGALFFLFFKGKREQRIIPIIEDPKNLSLQFVKTVGEVYFERGDHTNLAKKKVAYFRDFISNRYNIRNIEDNTESRQSFQKKTGADKEFTKTLLDYVFMIDKATVVPEPTLLRLNKLIETFNNL